MPGYSTMAPVTGSGDLPTTRDSSAAPPRPRPGLEAAALALRAVDVAGAAVLVADATGRMVVANRAARSWLGVTDLEELHRSALGRVEILTADQSGPLPGRYLPMTQALRGLRVDQLELVLVGPDATRRRVRVSADPVLGPDGGIAGGVVVGWDVTAVFQQEPQAERTAAQLSAVAIARRAVLADTDPREAVARAILAVTGAASATVMEVHGEVLEVSAAAGAEVAPQQLRLDQPSVIRDVYESGRSRMVDDVAATPELDGDAFARLEQATGARIGTACWVPVLVGGQVLGVLTALFAVDAPPLDDTASTIRTMELLASEAALAIERDDLRRRLTAQAMSDELTGLANLRAWRAALARMPRRGGLAIIDLDHFKSVNDRAGHAAGDRVLHDFAQAVRSSTRAEDLVARIGGEEFAVMCPVGADVAVLVARLRARWAEVTRGHPIPVTFSAGVAARAPDEQPERTQGRADEALYAAKQTGRDRCVVAAGDEHRRD